MNVLDGKCGGQRAKKRGRPACQNYFKGYMTTKACLIHHVRNVELIGLKT